MTREPAGQSDLPAQVAAYHRIAWIAVLFIAGSALIYGALGLVVRGNLEYEQPPQFRIPFLVTGLFLAFGSIGLRRGQLRLIRLQAVASVRGGRGLVRHLAVVTIVSAALAELIGMLGLILRLVGGDKWDSLSLCAVALIVALSGYPRLAAWQRTVSYLTLGVVSS